MLTLQDLQHIEQTCRPLSTQGEVATYIPELAKANPNDFALTVTQTDGTILSVGDQQRLFPLQSISKVITLALALTHVGTAIFDYVGVSAIADPFNSIMRLEMDSPHRPHNPMINSGAIVVTSLLPMEGVHRKIGAILDLTRQMAASNTIQVNNKIYLSEKNTSDRNRALAYFLRSLNSLKGDVEDILDVYFQACSIDVSTDQLSIMAATLACDGYNPVSKQQVLSPEIAQACRAVMTTCGMYDGSGEFALHVGIPAKSGVGGGIMASAPQKCGIGVYSPALDPKGNSVSGLEALRLLSTNFKLRTL